MKEKDLIFSEDARIQLLDGVEALNKAVRTTMGPKGRNVLIQEKFRTFLTKDGVTVAKHVKLKDQIQNIGADLVKEVAQKTADEAGDGTTTATVLAYNLFKEGIKHITSGSDPLQIKKGMELAQDTVLKKLKDISKDVQNHSEIEDVATISANGDKEIGKMVAKAIKEVGNDGVITVEEAMGIKDELKITKGLQFQNGYLSPYFVTDTAKMESNLTDCYVLMYNDRIPHIKSILPVLEKCQTSKKPLLIICNQIDEDALNTMVVNKIRGNINVVIVKSPGFGDIEEQLKDIQVVTGGIIQNPSKGVVFTNVVDDLGFADNVIVNQKSCTIVCKGTDEEKVQNRVKELKTQIETTEEFMKDNIRKRIAKLTGGVAVIKVQAPSEIETKEKKDRVDDALGATKAAQDEGIIIGAGTAFLKVSESTTAPKNLTDDQKIGFNIVLKSIKRPFAQILKNAGESVDLVCNEILKEDINFGYNVRTDEFGDLYKSGVIDSFKVQRVALTNAISVASTLLTTECIIPYNPDPK